MSQPAADSRCRQATGTPRKHSKQSMPRNGATVCVLLRLFLHSPSAGVAERTLLCPAYTNESIHAVPTSPACKPRALSAFRARQDRRGIFSMVNTSVDLRVLAVGGRARFVQDSRSPEAHPAHCTRTLCLEGGKGSSRAQSFLNTPTPLSSLPHLRLCGRWSCSSQPRLTHASR